MGTKFFHCAGYKCIKKEECLRWHKHKELMDKEVDTRRENYVTSEPCIEHFHKNFIPASVYGQPSGDERA